MKRLLVFATMLLLSVMSVSAGIYLDYDTFTRADSDSFGVTEGLGAAYTNYGAGSTTWIVDGTILLNTTYGGAGGFKYSGIMNVPNNITIWFKANSSTGKTWSLGGITDSADGVCFFRKMTNETIGYGNGNDIGVPDTDLVSTGIQQADGVNYYFGIFFDTVRDKCNMFIYDDSDNLLWSGLEISGYPSSPGEGLVWRYVYNSVFPGDPGVQSQVDEWWMCEGECMYPEFSKYTYSVDKVDYLFAEIPDIMAINGTKPLLGDLLGNYGWLNTNAGDNYTYGGLNGTFGIQLEGVGSYTAYTDSSTVDYAKYNSTFECTVYYSGLDADTQLGCAEGGKVGIRMRKADGVFQYLNTSGDWVSSVKSLVVGPHTLKWYYTNHTSRIVDYYVDGEYIGQKVMSDDDNVVAVQLIYEGSGTGYFGYAIGYRGTEAPVYHPVVFDPGRSEYGVNTGNSMVRCLLDPAHINVTTSGPIRFLFKAAPPSVGDGRDSHYDGMYISEWNGSNLNTVESTRKNITVDGGSTFTITSPDQEQWSDWTDYSIDKTKNYTLSVYISGDNPNYLSYYTYGEDQYIGAYKYNPTNGKVDFELADWSSTGAVERTEAYCGMIKVESLAEGVPSVTPLFSDTFSDSSLNYSMWMYACEDTAGCGPDGWNSFYEDTTGLYMSETSNNDAQFGLLAPKRMLENELFTVSYTVLDANGYTESYIAPIAICNSTVIANATQIKYWTEFGHSNDCLTWQYSTIGILGTSNCPIVNQTTYNITIKANATGYFLQITNSSNGATDTCQPWVKNPGTDFVSGEFFPATAWRSRGGTAYPIITVKTNYAAYYGSWPEEPVVPANNISCQSVYPNCIRGEDADYYLFNETVLPVPMANGVSMETAGWVKNNANDAVYSTSYPTNGTVGMHLSNTYISYAFSFDHTNKSVQVKVYDQGTAEYLQMYFGGFADAGIRRTPSGKFQFQNYSSGLWQDGKCTPVAGISKYIISFSDVNTARYIVEYANSTRCTIAVDNGLRSGSYSSINFGIESGDTSQMYFDELVICDGTMGCFKEGETPIPEPLNDPVLIIPSEGEIISPANNVVLRWSTPYVGQYNASVEVDDGAGYDVVSEGGALYKMRTISVGADFENRMIESRNGYIYTAGTAYGSGQFKLYKINYDTGSVVNDITIDGMKGMAVDSNYLYFYSADTDTLYRYNATTLGYIDSFAIAGPVYEGGGDNMDISENYLWFSNATTGKLMRYTKTGQKADSYVGPTVALDYNMDFRFINDIPYMLFDGTTLTVLLHNETSGSMYTVSESSGYKLTNCGQPDGIRRSYAYDDEHNTLFMGVVYQQYVYPGCSGEFDLAGLSPFIAGKLPEGSYSWRVKVYNDAQTSDYVTGTFSVEDVVSPIVTITYPSDYYFLERPIRVDGTVEEDYQLDTVWINDSRFRLKLPYLDFDRFDRPDMGPLELGNTEYMGTMWDQYVWYSQHGYINDNMLRITGNAVNQGAHFDFVGNTTVTVNARMNFSSDGAVRFSVGQDHPTSSASWSACGIEAYYGNLYHVSGGRSGTVLMAYTVGQVYNLTIFANATSNECRYKIDGTSYGPYGGYSVSYYNRTNIAAMAGGSYVICEDCAPNTYVQYVFVCSGFNSNCYSDRPYAVSSFEFTNKTAMGDGTYTVEVLANDTSGNLGYDIVTFTVDTVYPIINLRGNNSFLADNSSLVPLDEAFVLSFEAWDEHLTNVTANISKNGQTKIYLFHLDDGGTTFEFSNQTDISSWDVGQYDVRIVAMNEIHTTTRDYHFDVGGAAYIVSSTCTPTLPIESSVAKMPVSFNIVAQGGNNNLTNATAKLTYGALVLNTPCVITSTGAYSSRADCNVSMQYYYSPALYDLEVSVEDDFFSETATMTNSSYCEYYLLLASRTSTNTVDFRVMTPGLNNISAQTPVVVNNTGNTPLELSVTAYDLVGSTFSGMTLPASAFRSGMSNATAVALENGVKKNLNFNVTAGTSANIYFFVSIPSTTYPQTYVSVSSWQIGTS